MVRRVKLVEITEENLQSVLNMKIKEGQRVAPNMYSLA